MKSAAALTFAIVGCLVFALLDAAPGGNGNKVTQPASTTPPTTTTTRRTTTTTTTTTTTRPSNNGNNGNQGNAGGDEKGRGPQKLQVKFNMRGKPVQMDLTRTSKKPQPSKVYISERSRVTQWTPPDTQEYDSYEDPSIQASFVQVNSTKNGNKKQSLMGQCVVDGVMYSVQPHTPNGLSRRPLPSNTHDVDIGGDTYRASQLDAKLDFGDLEEGVRQKVNQGQGRASSRRRRQTITTPQTYGIEMLIVVDYSLYFSWFMASGNSSSAAIPQIMYYFTNIVNGINMRYANLNQTDFSINVVLSGIFIATTPTDSSWTEAPSIKLTPTDTNVYAALEAFSVWVNRSAVQFDQATLFSGYSLSYYPTNSTTLRTISGLGNIESICDRKRKTTVCYENGEYSSIQTAAHELGHNLAAQHDGTGNNCSSAAQNIMATAAATLTNATFYNPFHFSSCSINYMRNYLFSIPTSTNCLLNSAINRAQNYSDLPGQRYSVDRQCQIIWGPGSYYCAGGARDRSICREMQCWLPDTARCWAGVETRAFDGTTCGNGSWCMNGDCVDDNIAPKTKDTCIYGDYLGFYNLDATARINCSQIGAMRPYMCYDLTYNTDCCSSCARARNVAAKGCEYGDRNPSYCTGTVQRRDCYDNTAIQQACCATTCANPDLAHPGCEYGNKASWCAADQLPAYQCYSVSSTCCETCRVFQTGPTGCEYGDRATWCSTLDYIDCSDPYYKSTCCQTCAKRANMTTTTTTTTTTTIPSTTRTTTTTTSTTTSTSTTTTPTTTTTTQPPPPSTTPQSNNVLGSCPTGDGAQFCSTLTALECYYYPTLCCATCAQYYTNKTGCEFGDQVPWCATYVQGPAECERPEVKQYCCQTCANLPSQAVCVDKADWCPTIFPGFCYDPQTEATCCSTCSRVKTAKSTCPYGDKFTWCATIYCNQNAAECCNTCV